MVGGRFFINLPFIIVKNTKNIANICAICYNFKYELEVLNMFKLHSEYKPTGDQPKAIEYLSEGIKQGKKFQTLLGVTGSRKNFYNGKYN